MSNQRTQSNVLESHHQFVPYSLFILSLNVKNRETSSIVKIRFFLIDLSDVCESAGQKSGLLNKNFLKELVVGLHVQHYFQDARTLLGRDFDT